MTLELSKLLLPNQTLGCYGMAWTATNPGLNLCRTHTQLAYRPMQASGVAFAWCAVPSWGEICTLTLVFYMFSFLHWFEAAKCSPSKTTCVAHVVLLHQQHLKTFWKIARIYGERIVLTPAVGCLNCTPSLLGVRTNPQRCG